MKVTSMPNTYRHLKERRIYCGKTISGGKKSEIEKTCKIQIRSLCIFRKILHPEYRELDCSTEQKTNILRKEGEWWWMGWTQHVRGWKKVAEGRAQCEAFKLIKSVTTYITGRWFMSPPPFQPINAPFRISRRWITALTTLHTGFTGTIYWNISSSNKSQYEYWLWCPVLI